MNENLENVFEFPCDFPIKVVGKNNSEFEVFVYDTIHKHFPQLTEGAIQSRPSKEEAYLAITVIVHALSKEQLDLLYKELTANDKVLFVL